MGVQCEGSVHVARWVDGELRLDHHPDVDSERTLVALGGAPPPCLAAHDLWRDAVADGGFLLEWAMRDELDTARRAWLRTALERLRNEGVQEFLHGLPIGRAERMGRVLAELTPALVDRAAMSVCHRLAAGDGPADPVLDDAVGEAVRRRLRRAFVTSTASIGHGARTAALIPFRCVVEPGATPSVAGRLSGRTSSVEVGVPSTWLADVWALGAATVDGALVLSASLDDAGLDVTVVEWSGPAMRLAPRLTSERARFADGGWHLDRR